MDGVPGPGTVTLMVLVGVPVELAIWKVIAPPGVKPLESVAFKPVL
jgi:hypothetical protein